MQLQHQQQQQTFVETGADVGRTASLPPGWLAYTDVVVSASALLFFASLTWHGLRILEMWCPQLPSWLRGDVMAAVALTSGIGAVVLWAIGAWQVGYAYVQLNLGSKVSLLVIAFALVRYFTDQVDVRTFASWTLYGFAASYTLEAIVDLWHVRARDAAPLYRLTRLTNAIGVAAVPVVVAAAFLL